MKVKNPVPDQPEGERANTAQNIHDHLNGNLDFTSPTPSLADYQIIINNVISTIALSTSAVTAARMAVQNKRAALNALDAASAQLAAFVDAKAAGDEQKILSTGFLVRTPPTPPALPAAPLGVVAVAGAFPGDLVVKWDPTDFALLYEVQTGADPNSNTGWVSHGTCSKTTMTVKNLPSGNYCWVRVRALGRLGAGPWSDPAAKTVP